MAKDIVTTRYTSDGGANYAMQVEGARTAITGNDVKLGLQVGVAGDKRPPKGFKPRTVRVYDPLGKLWRTVVCYTKTATLYAGGATTIDLPVAPGIVSDPITFNRMSAKGESDRAVTGDLYTT